MSEPVTRPLFFEGQILAGADLTAVVEHARAEGARDRRYLHTPGIATGLLLSGRELKTAEPNPKAYQEVTLGAGVAVDRTGRQVVLAADTRLDETYFDELRVRVSDPLVWYPVFVRGVDQAAPLAPQAAGACGGGGGATRVEESAEVTFSGPGQGLDAGAGEVPEPADGPGDPGGTLVLVGFVQWDQTLKRFSKVALEVDGVRPSYAGVRADEVVARSGRLVVRSGDGADQPALVLDAADGELRFGPQNGAGEVTAVLKVTAKGEVIATSFSPALAAGTLVESGVITDGLLVPLPAGVTAEQVDEGKVKLHVHLTPRFQGLDPLLPGTGFALLPVECRAEGRRVICRFRWLDLQPPATIANQLSVVTGNPDFVNLPALATPPLGYVDVPGCCDYTVLAYAAPAAGTSS